MTKLLEISEANAEAAKELAKFGTAAVALVNAAGGYVAKVLGTVPEDTVGLLGGDWIRFKRAENMMRLSKKVEAMQAARKVTEQVEVSAKLALPLLAAAADENREILLDVWAKLLAAALDPARCSTVRSSFIDAIKRMDPLDALVFGELNSSLDASANLHNYLAGKLKVREDEIEVSLQNLAEIGLVFASAEGNHTVSRPNVHLLAKGRELKAALS